MKKMFALAAVLVVSSSSFAFQSSMSAADVKTEVTARAKNCESIESIAASAKAAGIGAAVIQSALDSAKSSFCASVAENGVFNSLVTAGYEVGDLLPPTAAGNPQNTTQTLGNGFSGLNNSSFGQSRAATVGGGGRQSVSGS